VPGTETAELSKGLKKKKKKNAGSVTITLLAWIRKGWFCFVFCTTQWMQRHTATHLENKNKRSFSVGNTSENLPSVEVRLKRLKSNR
jgi:hypothetical protein